MSIKYDNNCYPGLVQNDETCWRFTDKSNQYSERLLFNNWWREILNQYGIKTQYFVNTFNVLSADNLYGEQPTKTFAKPIEFVMGVNLNDNAITLSQYGFMSDDEITAFIHIESFEASFKETLSDVWSTQYDVIEPKAGDIFQLSEFGDDRPSNRQPKYFEVTEKIDEDIAQINPLAGHYVFLVKAKRYDYSFEPGIPFSQTNETEGIGEATIGNTFTIGVSGATVIDGNDQIYEDSFAGRLSGGDTPATQDKKDGYDQYNIDRVSKEEVLDMTVNDTDVYGDYY